MRGEGRVMIREIYDLMGEERAPSPAKKWLDQYIHKHLHCKKDQV